MSTRSAGGMMCFNIISLNSCSVVTADANLRNAYFCNATYLIPFCFFITSEILDVGSSDLSDFSSGPNIGR